MVEIVNKYATVCLGDDMYHVFIQSCTPSDNSSTVIYTGYILDRNIRASHNTRYDNDTIEFTYSDIEEIQDTELDFTNFKPSIDGRLKNLEHSVALILQRLNKIKIQ